MNLLWALWASLTRSQLDRCFVWVLLFSSQYWSSFLHHTACWRSVFFSILLELLFVLSLIPPRRLWSLKHFVLILLEICSRWRRCTIRGHTKICETSWRDYLSCTKDREITAFRSCGKSQETDKDCRPGFVSPLHTHLPHGLPWDLCM